MAKLTVAFTKKKMKGFIGMNPHAAKKHKIKNYPKNTILIRKGMTKGRTRRTIKHEKVEHVLMSLGLGYKISHKAALTLEKML